MASGGAGQGSRGRSGYLAASIVAQLCALTRYTALARLLGPEQLGMAVALILTAQFLESVTDSGSDRFLVQDRRGNEPRVGRLIHLVWLTRGLAIAAALVLLSWPLASFFGSADLVRGFVILALAPLIAGFANLDYRRVQRDSDFRAEARVLVASEIASLAVTLVAAIVIRDFTAILYGLITRSIVAVLVSHAVSERRYALGYSAEDAPRIARFALPLMTNGLLLFFGAQGDRILVGGQAGLAALGQYSATLLLALYPSAILQRFMTTIHLPLIAEHAESPVAQQAAIEAIGGQTTLLTIAMTAGFALLAPVVIPVMFGAQFQLPTMLIAAIGAMQMIRFARLWPVTAALALGSSATVLLSNLVRLAAFPAAFIAFWLFGSLLSIVLAFAIAELAALGISLALLQRLTRRVDPLAVARLALMSASIALVLAWASVASGEISWLLPALASLPLMFALYRLERDALFQAIAMLGKLRPNASRHAR